MKTTENIENLKPDDYKHLVCFVIPEDVVKEHLKQAIEHQKTIGLPCFQCNHILHTLEEG